VSLRAIMRAAGVNTAAIHYHYGSRDELARAVLKRVLNPLQMRRLQLLDELVSSSEEPPTAQQLVTALIRPDFEAVVTLCDRNPAGAGLIGTIYSRPTAFVKALVEESFAPVADAFLPYLLTALPHLSPAELSWRVRWAVFGVLGAVLCADETEITGAHVEGELARGTAVTVGALEAPPATLLRYREMEEAE
jgi:AcrR family transcriptional regulator